jgi:hypothetical protein
MSAITNLPAGRRARTSVIICRVTIGSVDDVQLTTISASVIKSASLSRPKPSDPVLAA